MVEHLLRMDSNGIPPQIYNHKPTGKRREVDPEWDQGTKCNISGEGTSRTTFIAYDGLNKKYYWLVVVRGPNYIKFCVTLATYWELVCTCSKRTI